MQGLGLRNGIDPPEKFFAEVEKGSALALDMLRSSVDVSPNSKLLKEIHERIFCEALQEAGEFRQQDKVRGTESSRESAICTADMVVGEGNHNAERCENLLTEEKAETRVETVACCHLGLMFIQPFPDIQNRFVNRTVAAVVMEQFPKVGDGGGGKKGILRGTKKPAAITRWRHNPQDTYGTEECSPSGKASRSEQPFCVG